MGNFFFFFFWLTEVPNSLGWTNPTGLERSRIKPLWPLGGSTSGLNLRLRFPKAMGNFVCGKEKEWEMAKFYIGSVNDINERGLD